MSVNFRNSCCLRKLYGMFVFRWDIIADRLPDSRGVYVRRACAAVEHGADSLLRRADLRKQSVFVLRGDIEMGRGFNTAVDVLRDGVACLVGRFK